MFVYKEQSSVPTPKDEFTHLSLPHTSPTTAQHNALMPTAFQHFSVLLLNGHVIIFHWAEIFSTNYR